MSTCRTNVGRRYGSVRKDVRGFFPGAIVKRGRDWEWGPQDGKLLKRQSHDKSLQFTGCFNKMFRISTLNFEKPKAVKSLCIILYESQYLSVFFDTSLDNFGHLETELQQFL